MRRTTLGILAVLLLVVGIIAAFRGPEDGSAAGFAGGAVRVGLVLGALWLAWPQLASLASRAPRWILNWFFGNRFAGPKDSKAAMPAASEQSSSAKPQPRPKRPRRRTG